MRKRAIEKARKRVATPTVNISQFTKEELLTELMKKVNEEHKTSVFFISKEFKYDSKSDSTKKVWELHNATHTYSINSQEDII